MLISVTGALAMPTADAQPGRPDRAGERPMEGFEGIFAGLSGKADLPDGKAARTAEGEATEPAEDSADASGTETAKDTPALPKDGQGSRRAVPPASDMAVSDPDDDLLRDVDDEAGLPLRPVARGEDPEAGLSQPVQPGPAQMRPPPGRFEAAFNAEHGPENHPGVRFSPKDTAAAPQTPTATAMTGRAPADAAPNGSAVTPVGAGPGTAAGPVASPPEAAAPTAEAPTAPPGLSLRDAPPAEAGTVASRRAAHAPRSDAGPGRFARDILPERNGPDVAPRQAPVPPTGPVADSDVAPPRPEPGRLADSPDTRLGTSTPDGAATPQVPRHAPESGVSHVGLPAGGEPGRDVSLRTGERAALGPMPTEDRAAATPQRTDPPAILPRTPMATSAPAQAPTPPEAMSVVVKVAPTPQDSPRAANNPADLAEPRAATATTSAQPIPAPSVAALGFAGRALTPAAGRTTGADTGADARGPGRAAPANARAAARGAYAVAGLGGEAKAAAPPAHPAAAPPAAVDPALERADPAGRPGEVELPAAQPLSEARGPQAATQAALSARAETPAPVMRQVAESLHRLADGGVEIQLRPEELGRVRMQMVQGDHGLTVMVTAERGETLDLMRRHIDQLARALQDMGYSGTQFSFSGGERRPGAPQAGLAADPSEGPATPADPVQSPRRAPPPATGRASLDITL